MRFNKAVHVCGRTQIRDRLRVFFFPILFFVQVFKRKVSGKLNWKKIVPEPFPTHDLLGDEFSLTRVFLSCKRVSVKYTGIFSANF